jgi:drug/metabolite transporter (DMT)-like permease
LKAVLLTSLAMVAFASNSILCRLALGQETIDPASFASIRVLSGATVLLLVAALGRRSLAKSGANARSALMLFVYMVFFSFAYATLGAATGALILFGAVQITMITAALRGGERLPPASWFGLGLAVIGLIYLVLPGITAPDPLGAALMTVAGVGWGLYSLLGRGVADPLAATTVNFFYSAPLALVVSLMFRHEANFTSSGLALAAASGVVASGCGYVIWYAALSHLNATRASIVQLSVPIIAAIGAVLLLSEHVTTRLLLAAVATLGGVALVLAQPTTAKRA